MKQPTETDTRMGIPPPPLPHESTPATRLHPYAVIIVFLILTALATGDLLEIIPYFAPLVASPLFPFYHETHDLLALMVALYAAHKLSPAVGWRAVAWFVAVHVPYAYLVFAKELPELVRLTVLVAAALFGIYIIAVRNDLEARLRERAADLEAQRAAERHRADQLRTLREAGHTLTSELHLETVLQTLVEAARRMVDARYAALAVLDEAGTLAQFYTAGIGEAERRQIGEPPQGRGLLSASLRGGAPIRLADLRHDPRSVGFPPHHPDMTTFLGVPIVARGVVMGSLYLTDKASGQSFTQEDEDLAMGLAADAAIAIENARLFDTVQQLAITDSLTGLFNRRHFFDQAEREFQRARRYRRPLCAIMLDIDHFKRVNDTYGHAAGDQVLQALAARCRENLRDMDLLGRYGGEEFVALLPENDLPGTRDAAERLRQHVAEMPIDTSRGPVAVTVSLGVAVCTENCAELAALIAQADQALYVAKSAGRNQVSGA